VGLGLVGYYLSSFLDFLGLQYITVGLERLILFLTPTFVLLISATWLRQHIGRLQWMALAVSYAGIVFVFVHDLKGGGANVLLGSALVLGSAAAYAAYLLLSGEWSGASARCAWWRMRCAFPAPPASASISCCARPPA
jgi:drug/metabolite transporter (DMT)-like permease